MKRTLRIVLVTLLALGATWYVLRNVDGRQLLTVLESSNVWLLVLAIPVTIASHVVRADRWRRLLSHIPTHIRLVDAFNAVMVGYAASIVIPRSGELLRPAMLTARTSIPIGTSMSSIVIERMLDVLALVVGIVFVILLSGQRIASQFPEISSAGIITSIVVPVVLIVGVTLVLALSQRAQRLITRTVGRCSPTIAVKLRRIMRTMSDGVGILQKAHAWPMVLAETAVMWLLYTVPLWLVVEALPLQLPSFTALDAFTLLVVITVGIAVAPTPGALGVYHGFAQTALVKLHGTTADEGLGFALLAWVINYGVQLLLGGGLLVAYRRKQTPT